MLIPAISTLYFICYASATAIGLERREITFTGPAQEYTLVGEHSHFDELNREQMSLQVKSPSESGPPTQASFAVRAAPTTVWQPKDPDAVQRARRRSIHRAESEAIEWEEVHMLAPDVEDKHTLAQLARMAGNAYAVPGESSWYELDRTWNRTFRLGWQGSADGFRGHVFLSPDDSIVVLSIKGTTLNGPTSKKDKFNDNLLFSCCCAWVDFSWVFNKVCDCYAKHYRCDNTCLSEALIEDSLFYNIGVEMVTDLRYTYPTSSIWLVGHSLGGALASLLGTTFGLPAVAFESPGERLAARRLHLPLPPPDARARLPHAPVTHVYHNADPIPQGACTGWGSPCASAGYALETRCHLGRSIVFDTVTKFGWAADVRKHPIREVILNVLEAQLSIGDGWEVDEDGTVRDVPVARYEEDCVDCFKWEFGDYKKPKL